MNMRHLITLVEGVSVKSDQSRLKRAAALGFDTSEPLYHGTRAGSFKAFQVYYRKAEQLGFGIHLTPDQSFAERYAHDTDVARKGKTPHVFVGYIRKGKMLDANAIVREGSPEFALALKLAGPRAHTQKDENDVRCIYMQNAIDATNGKRAERLIQEAGYDTIVYQAKIGQRGIYGATYSGKAVSYLVLDPKNIRHIDAEFALDAVESDDLMA